ncbi:hypothetical protein EV368DRAFT_25567, partial [Lentinula lateritia]
VGISLELPGPSSQERNLRFSTLHEYLLNKGESYTKIPDERFNVDAWRGSNLGQIITENGTFLKHVDAFDNVEFGVSGKDVRAMAPSTRKILEHCFLALYDSGINYRGREMCFTAGSMSEITSVTESDEFDSEGSFSGAPSMIANRVSYHLDLTGPSIPTDTACSSTATALHLAINALSNGDCEAAVVGGCQLNYRFADWFNYSQGHILAKDGKCKPFDASADGFSRGEGVVAIVIKPLDHALKENDYIYSVILGTAVTANGSALPPNAPLPSAQKQAMIKAFQRANRLPKDVAYFECHATGTAKGDPTEANWVGETCSNGRTGPLWIGSIKGNIGHTEIVSFLASLAKVMLIFQHSTIPPNANFCVPNPAIHWQQYQLQVPRIPQNLSVGPEGTSLISIASSGIGGTNAHVVLESFPKPLSPIMETTRKMQWPTIACDCILLAVGGPSPRAVALIGAEILKLSQEQSLLFSLAVESMRRARQMLWRSFAIINPVNPLLSQFPEAVMVPRTPPHVVFVFSGQGPQYFDMGRQLYQHCPEFKKSVLISDQIYHQITGQSLIYDYGIFEQNHCTSIKGIWPSTLTLPALTIFQIALFDLLNSLSIVPNVILGHSAGETTALYASGAGSREMTIALSVARGRVFSGIENYGGAMAALSCNADQASALISMSGLDHSEHIDIACYNSATAVTVSGPQLAIDKVLLNAEGQKILGQKLKTHVPVHSSMMEMVRDEYWSAVEKVFLAYDDIHTPRIPIVSSVTGCYLDSPFTPEYFWKNARQPVMFSQPLETLWGSHPNSIFVEIGPHPVLGTYISQQHASNVVIALACRPHENQQAQDIHTFHNGLGKLFLGGYNAMDLTRLYLVTSQCRDQTRNFYPDYPLVPRRFPLYPNVAGYQKQIKEHAGPLNHPYLRINRATHPLLAQHVVHGEAIMPAAGFLEMAFEFGATSLYQVDFHAILPLTTAPPLHVHVDCNYSLWCVKSSPKLDHMEDATQVRFNHPSNSTKGITRSCFPKFHGNFDSNSYFLPAQIGTVSLHQPPEKWYLPSIVYSFLQIIDWNPDAITYVILILDESGHPLCSIDNFQFRRHQLHHRPNPVYRHALFHQPLIVPDDVTRSVSTATQSSVGSYLVLLASHKTIQFLTESCRQYLHALCMHKHFAKVLISGIEGIMICTLAVLIYSPLGPNLDISRRNALSDVLLEYSKQATIVCYQQNERAFPESYSSGCIYSHAVRKLLPGLDHSSSGVDAFSCDLAIVELECPTIQDIQAQAQLLSHILLPNGMFILTEDPQSSSKANLLSSVKAVFQETNLDIWEALDSALAIRGFSSPLLVYSPLFVKTASYLYHYCAGQAINVQQYLGNVWFAEKADIWMTTAEGPDADEASGLIRTLQKECPNWVLRLVIFPISFSIMQRVNFLELFPYYACGELELNVSETGILSVPRITTERIVIQDPPKKLLEPPAPPSMHVTVSVHAAHDFLNMRCFTGTVLKSSVSGLASQATVAGIVACQDQGKTVIVEAAYVTMVKNLQLAPLLLAPLLLGLAIAAFGFPPLLFGLHTHSKETRILLTHSMTRIGTVILHVLQAAAVTVETADDDSISYLTTLKPHSFDFVISGHDGRPFMQIFKNIVKKDRGKVFMWGGPESMLANEMTENPHLIGHALQVSLDLVLSTRSIHDLVNLEFPLEPCVTEDMGLLPDNYKGDVLNGDRVYVLLGGAGSIGPHLALWMYQHGARHIILTSRTGLANLQCSSNTWASRVFLYLSSCLDLDITIIALDSANQKELRSRLLENLEYPIGGCLLLSAVRADGMFFDLKEREFHEVQQASFGVFEAFCSVVNVHQLEFFVAFSSVSAMFGNAGQANYALAKCKIDGHIKSMKNALSFICPPIENTTMVNTTKPLSSISQHTIPDLIQWMNDALTQIISGSGGQIYIPSMNWDNLSRSIGFTSSLSHLQFSKHTQAEVVDITCSPAQQLIDLILTAYIDVPSNEFSSNIPLTSYGLDSLSASQLSFSLNQKFGLKISQIQLLSNVSTDDL